ELNDLLHMVETTDPTPYNKYTEPYNKYTDEQGSRLVDKIL
ncbi:15134_t:CDS:1, partial [Racocetra persica]